jgi:hypothetical protein
MVLNCLMSQIIDQEGGWAAGSLCFIDTIESINKIMGFHGFRLAVTSWGPSPPIVDHKFPRLKPPRILWWHASQHHLESTFLNELGWF